MCCACALLVTPLPALLVTPLPNPNLYPGSHGHFARRRTSHIMKDDGSLIKSDGKSSKRGGTTGSGAYEVSKIVSYQQQH